MAVAIVLMGDGSRRFSTRPPDALRSDLRAALERGERRLQLGGGQSAHIAHIVAIQAPREDAAA